MENKTIPFKPEVKEQIFNVHRTVKGFYKASIMEPDEQGNISEAFSTGWKPNTILNCGLDKIAYMPWAQTFQFCLIGDYPYGPGDSATASFDETMLKAPRKINAFYLPGQGNCGHLVSGSTVRLFRTFDFYRESDNVTYTEVGFKETPAADTLFSKIRLDPTMSLHAGQFMRITYELRINMSPANLTGSGVTPNPYPTFTGWSSGSGDLEAIQKIGLCGVDSGSGLAIPIDEGGFCNEPFAPGQLSFGPGFGFVNRWYNGANVNYYPNGPSTFEPNPYKAIGPLTEFQMAYQNYFSILEYGITQSLVLGKSGSFCVPSANTYLPRNYFTTDFIYGSYVAYGGSRIYTTFNYNGTGGNTEGFVPGTGRYDTVTVTLNDGVVNPALSYASSKFTHLDALWTPYCKLSSLSSGVYSPLLTINNTNLFNEYFYDPSMQTSGSLSYPYYPSPLASPSARATASAYEPRSTLFEGRISTNIANSRIPNYFPYWDDWNPFIATGSLPNSIRDVNNQWVRGSSCFLSTTGSVPAVFSASVDRSNNTSSKVYNYELPLLIVPYSQSAYYRDKYCIFTNKIANNLEIPTQYWSSSSAPGWRTIGLGPTSANVNPETMVDAAKYNGYVYVLENPQFKDKDYSLKVIFRYSWGRA